MEKMNIKYYYNQAADTPSDINEHLPTLRRFAEQCEHVTEMGVRGVVSSWAMAIAKPKYIRLYDINNNQNIENYVNLVASHGIDVKFIQNDTTKCEIDDTDMLFIDTLHNYHQLKKELELHGNKVKKFLLFHDTVTFGHRDESGFGGIGLVPAIQEFCQLFPEWKLLEHYTNNNGLTILAKV